VETAKKSKFSAKSGKHKQFGWNIFDFRGGEKNPLNPKILMERRIKQW